MTLTDIEDALFYITTNKSKPYDIRDLEDIWKKSSIDNKNIDNLFKTIEQKPSDRSYKNHVGISIMEFISITPRLKAKLREHLMEERKIRTSHSWGHGG